MSLRSFAAAGRHATAHRSLTQAGKGLALASALALMIAGVPACAQPPAWQRDWTVHGFDCPACSAEDRAWLQARVGQVVSIAPGRFLNPLYENCDKGVDYSDVRARTPAEARDFLGRGRLASLGAAAPLAGLVRCAESAGPPNVVARVVIDGARAYLLHESGAVVVLR